MVELRWKLGALYTECMGAVVFARGPCPEWITSLLEEQALRREETKA
jgi:hypothetical protein